MLGGNEKKLLERNDALLRSIERRIAAKEAEVANPRRRDIDADDDIVKASTASARARMGVATTSKEDKVRMLLADVVDVPEARSEQEAGFARFVVSKKDALEIGAKPFSIIVSFCDENGESCPAPSLYDVDDNSPIFVKGIWGAFGGRKMVSLLWEDFDAFKASAPVFEPFAKLGKGIHRWSSYGTFECWMMGAINGMTTVKGGVPLMKVSMDTDTLAVRLVDWFKKNRTIAEARASSTIRAILSLAKVSFEKVFGVDVVSLVFPDDDEWPDDATVYAPSLFGGTGAFYKNASEMAGGKRRRPRHVSIKTRASDEEEISLFDATA